MMFFAAAMIMLPVVTLLLMINITIGVVTRSAPTLNLFSFGFPISMLGVFFILYISTDVLGYAFNDLIEAAMTASNAVLRGLPMAEESQDSQEKTEGLPSGSWRGARRR